jgi:hypothetical protein
MISNEILKEIVHENRRDFEKLLQKIQSEESLLQKYLLAKQAVRFAVDNSTGYYSSSVLEKVFLEVAQSHVCEGISEGHRRNSFLHVVTECYETGGHTRVVGQWMEFGKEEQVHSLFFTEEPACIPERLKDAVTGEIYMMPDSMTDLEKGLELRKIASGYEFVILHIHTHDVVPLVAFGTVDFKRPVIFFNHADHRFWVGLSISDVVAELRTWGQELTLNMRGGERNPILNVPPNSLLFHRSDKCLARQKLGLPRDKKILLTIGSVYKYRPMEKYDFLGVVEKILCKDEDVILLAIGPTFEEYPEWKRLSQKLNGRILALGLKKPCELIDYISAADCSLDSFPLSGGLASMEQISGYCPMISLQCPAGKFDYILKSSAFCTNEEELIQKVELILNDEVQAVKFIENQQKCLTQENNWEVWQRNFRKVIELAGDSHKLYSFKSIDYGEITDLDMYLVLEGIKKRKIFSIPSFLSIYKLKTNVKKRYVWDFLGKQFKF